VQRLRKWLRAREDEKKLHRMQQISESTMN
jgi:hypothetical protein